MVTTVHSEAFQWVEQYATGEPVTVLDIGGRDINGSVRSLFPGATAYTVLDILPGDNVDVEADAATWQPDCEYDVIVSCETFEHTAVWPAICATAYLACKPGGMLVATMAGPDRPAHSAYDGSWTLHPDEFYANIDPDELREVLAKCGWEDIVIDQQTSPSDVRTVARKSPDRSSWESS
jgi:hypothetical protein